MQTQNHQINHQIWYETGQKSKQRLQNSAASRNQKILFNDQRKSVKQLVKRQAEIASPHNKRSGQFLF